MAIVKKGENVDDSNSGLKDYIDMMKQIKAPPELVEKAVTNACELKQMKLEEHCPELEGIDDFCIDDYRGPSAVIWKRKDGFGADYYWSSTHFAEVCDLVTGSCLPVTVCNGERDVVVVRPA